MSIEEITDAKIQALRETSKRVTNPNTRTRNEEKHERTEYELVAEDDRTRFRIYMRQNQTYSEDFSCGIRWMMPSGETLTLARYNGPSHIHDDIRYRCHIHRATEEAIRQGRKPESHAEATTRYHTVEGALHCLLTDFNVSGLDSAPDVKQEELFKR